MTEPVAPPLVIEAIAPSWQSSKIHLHVADYLPRGRPGRRAKERCLKVTPMCGASATGSTTAARVPLKDALHWPTWKPACDGEPFPTPPVPERRWCVACLGHAAELLGLVDNLVRALVFEQDIRSSDGLRVQGQMVTSWAENCSSTGVVTGDTGVAHIEVKGALP